MLDNYTFGVRQSQKQNPRIGLRPAIRATAWLWLVFLALALVTLFTGWASLLITSILELLVSFCAGLLAGYFISRSKSDRPRYLLNGAVAGMLLPVTAALTAGVIGIFAGLGTMGTALGLMLPYLISLPLVIGLCTLLGALGALTAKFFYNKRKA